eukprot:gb/GEZJ01003639.1/.p1 GENE.gb/GEZJ01003639.1/~~gb/GEZJ01003639.1/.p1  ORF type:complete len:107 (+),score=4.01 gb/GEZJ01003639.1/:235-555(+)
MNIPSSTSLAVYALRKAGCGAQYCRVLTFTGRFSMSKLILIGGSWAGQSYSALIENRLEFLYQNGDFLQTSFWNIFLAFLFNPPLASFADHLWLIYFKIEVNFCNV